MSTSTDTTLRLSKEINAKPAAVFAAWTEPSQLKEWSCPEGISLAAVEVDLKVGGNFMLDMRDPEGGKYTAFGEYREIDAPHKLVYTWDWRQEDHAVGETLVTVEFKAQGDKTIVEMVHEKLPTVEMRDSHNEGWTSILEKLEARFA